MICLPERIQAFIEPEPMSGCWLWSGGVTGGYGQVWWKGRTLPAHRIIYGLLCGPITKPQLDHLCRNRLCVNPAHLDQVTAAENTQRGLHGRVMRPNCSRCGGEYEDVSGRWNIGQKTYRICRRCRAANQRRYTRRKNGHLS